jgi:hypothetical protein
MIKKILKSTSPLKEKKKTSNKDKNPGKPLKPGIISKSRIL